MMISYPPITKFMNKNQLSPVGCFEIYHYNKDPIEYMMFLEHKEVFEELQKTKFVAANLLQCDTGGCLVVC